MELQDITNSKSIKVAAVAGLTTVAVASASAPALAQSGTYNKPSSSYSAGKDDKDCGPDQQPTKPTPQPTPTTQTPPPVATPTPPPPTTPTPPVTPPPATVTPPVHPPKSDTITPAAVVTPQELPKTGVESLVAPVAAAGVAGYFGNLFRLKRKQAKQP